MVEPRYAQDSPGSELEMLTIPHAEVNSYVDAKFLLT